MAPSNRSTTRRILTWVLVVVTIVPVLLAVGGVVLWTRFKHDTVGQVAFDRRLQIPPLAPSHVDEQGRRVFDLMASTGRTDLGQGRRVPTWGYNGGYLGPTLRAHRGEQVLVHVRNDLPEPTTVHWHGMHLPPTEDGGPHQPIARGATWSPSWRIDQPAATLWYHPHPHGRTSDQVSMGLAGLFIVDDDTSDRLTLPHTYGVDDLPVVVQDKSISGSGHIRAGRGSQVVVNGTPRPYAVVETSLVRLRLVNGSSMRVYDLRLDNAAPFTLVGTDGGLLAAPARLDHLVLAPGERAEVVVGMRPGETRTLRSTGVGADDNFIARRFNGGDDRLDILQLRAAPTLRPSAPLPDRLSGQVADGAGAGTTTTDLPDLPRVDAQVVRERTFDMSGNQINGRSMTMSQADLTTTVDTTEAWVVRNDDGNLHSFHVHDARFRVLRPDSSVPSEPWLQGPKDTVYLPPHTAYRLLVRFTDYTDRSVPYMYHCHMLNHEDQGMMGQFLVLRPGETPGQIAAVASAPGDGSPKPTLTEHQH